MIAALLLILSGFYRPYHVTDNVKSVQAAYKAEGIEVTANVVVRPCGGVNAYYSPVFDLVTVCTELGAVGDEATRFVIAHELAHAAIREHRVPDVDGEAAADELAALVLESADDRDAVVGGAALLMSFPNPNKGDPHPPSLERARAALCIDDGADDDGADPNCRVYYKRAVASWLRALSDDHAK